jgi:Zn-dependent protease
MDPLGSLMILGRMPIGWAKPVPVDPRNIRNPRTGMPLVAFAGPMSNLILAVLSCMVYFAIGHLIHGSSWYTMLILFIQFNFSLAIFNLLPIMPLDGSKIITAFMSDRIADRYEATMERMGVFPLIIIVAFEALGTGPGIIAYWFHFWKPLIGPVLAVFRVPNYVYPY